MRQLIFLLPFLISHLLSAQFIEQKSLELSIPGSQRQFGIVPTEEYGVAFYNEVVNLESTSKRNWGVILFDTLLNVSWKTYFESDYNFRITHVKYHDGFIYLLFEDINIPSKRIFFARSKIDRDNFQFFELSEFLPQEIIGFEALGNSLFLIGSDDGRPSILKYSFGDPRPTALRGLYNDNNDLLSISKISSPNLIQIITRMKPRHGKKRILLIKQFDEDGEIHKDIYIDSKRGYDLLDCAASTDIEGNTCVVGTYSEGGRKFSHGVFTMVVGKETEHQIYYYNYLNLRRFFDHLSEKEKTKLERKLEATEGSGKKQNYRVNLVPGEIIKKDDEWIFSGEAVEFIERNTRGYGNLWPEEYRLYSHAMILGIGKDGKLKWDNSINMNGLKTRSSSRKVFISDYLDHQLVYFAHHDQIKYKQINGSKDLDKYNEIVPEHFQSQSSEMDEFDKGEILPWFDNYFLQTYTISKGMQQGRENNLFFLKKIVIN